MNKLLLIFGIFIIITSCKEFKDVEFVEVRKVEFTEIRNGDIIATAHAIFNNPNKKGGNVKKVEISVFVKDKMSGKVLREESFKVDPNTQFEIPLDLEISFEEMAKNLLGSLFSKEKEKSIALHFKGNIWVSLYGITRKVPVDYHTALKYKL